MRRWLTVIALTVFAALGLGVAAPSPALANGNPLPDPIRILPSTAKASIYHLPKFERSMAAAYLMTKTILGSVSKKNERAAFQAIADGVATPAQTVTATTVGQKFKPPSLKVKSLVKSAGTAAVAMFGQDILIGLGHGGLELLGVDVEGNVCGTRNDFVSFLASVDCTQWQMTQEAIAQANADMNAELVLPMRCAVAPAYDDAEMCVEILSIYVNSSNQVFTCLAVTVEGALSVESQVAAYVRTMFARPDGTFVGTTNSIGKVSSGAGTSAQREACGNPTDGLYWQRGMPFEGQPLTVLGLVEYQQDGNGAWYWVGAEVEDIEPVWSVSPDPERRIRCEVELVGGGEVLNAWSAPFRESEGEAPAPVCPQLPPEVDVERITLWLEGGGQDHQLYDESITPEFDTFRTDFPQCLNGSCVLDLRKVGLGTCFASNVDCAEWYSDPDKDDNYECFYGGTDVGAGGTKVALAECTVYAPLFKPDAGTTASPYGDPETGEPLAGGPGTFPETVLDPTQPRECFPTGWGVLNPVEWVVKPVQCALEWAFVPRPSVLQAQQEKVQEAWSNSGPGRFAAVITAWEFGSLPSGCDGITVDVWFLGPPFQIMQACPGDMLADMAMWARIFGNVSMAVLSTMAITRLISGIVQYPGLGGSSSP